MKVNDDIKNAIKQNNLKFWQVGLALGMNDRKFFPLVKDRINKRKERTNFANYK